MLGCNFFHFTFEQLHGNLFFCKRVFPGICPSRFGKEDNTPKVVEIRSSRPACHLVKLLHREPVPAHGKCIEDYLRCREIHACTKRCSRDHRHQFPAKEFCLDITPLLRCETGMVCCSPHPQCVGNRVTPGPCVGEDDRLATESL